MKAIKDGNVYKVAKSTKRNYYKNWTQPTLTSNTSNSSFVLSDQKSGADAFRAFDSDTNGTGWGVQGTAGSFSGKSYWLQMVSDVGLNITNIAITNRKVSDNSTQAITKGYVQISNNGTSWTTVTNWTNSNTGGGATWNIPISYSGFYKYIRLYVTDATTSNSGNHILVMNIKLTATVQGTSSDYSSYKDMPIYYVVN